MYVFTPIKTKIDTIFLLNYAKSNQRNTIWYIF